MEELTLTDPVVVPEKVTDKYRVVTLTMSTETTGPPPPVLPPVVIEPGFINIVLKDNHNVQFSHSYFGKTATDMIKFLNTANLTTKSMHKRILERLSTDGVLPGTVSGTPDPPASDPFEVKE